MGQQDVLCHSVILLSNETAYGCIGEMAITPHEPLLQVPWIWPNSQHFKVMIGFQDEHVRSADPPCDIIRNIADVRELRDLHSTTRDAVRDRFSCIVRHAERKNLHITCSNGDAGLYGRNSGTTQFKLFGLQRGDGAGGEKCFDGQVFQKHLQAACVVAMFVCDQDGVDAIGILADGFQTFRNFFPAHSGINE